MTRPHLNLIVSQQHHLQTRWDLGLHQMTLRKGMVQSMVGVSILRPDAWLFGCCSGFLQCWRSWWGSPGAWGEHRRYLRLQEISLLIGWALGSLDPCWLRMYYIIFLKKVNVYFFKIGYWLFLFWLCWVFITARGLSLVVASGGCSLAAVRGLLTVATSLVAEHGL